MDNNLSNFERSIKESYESFEVPFDQSGWTAVEDKLKAQSSGFSGRYSTIFVAATVLLAVIGSMFFLTIWSPLLMNKANQPSAIKSVDVRTSPNGSDSAQALDQNPTENSSAASDIEMKSSFSPNSEGGDMLPEGRSAKKSGQAGFVESEKQSDAQLKNLSESALVSPALSSKQDPSSDALVISASATTGCAGESVEFEAHSGKIDGKYLWNFGDGSFSSHPNPVHEYNKPGSYHVTLSVTSSSDGQIRTQTLNKSIVIYPAPEARFDWEFINTPSRASEVKFINRSEKASEAHWLIGKQATEEINPSVMFSKKGEYPVKLMVSNDYGCTDSMYQVVRINENYNLLAPESFTPNNDGLNDTFLPEALKIRNVKFKMVIYHNNKPIFETSDRFEPWKGVLPGGVLAAKGTAFPWVVQLTNEGGLEEYYSGTVTVMP
jgi:PKD repeat protein